MLSKLLSRLLVLSNKLVPLRIQHCVTKAVLLSPSHSDCFTVNQQLNTRLGGPQSQYQSEHEAGRAPQLVSIRTWGWGGTASINLNMRLGGPHSQSRCREKKSSCLCWELHMIPQSSSPYPSHYNMHVAPLTAYPHLRLHTHCSYNMHVALHSHISGYTHTAVITYYITCKQMEGITPNQAFFFACYRKPNY
jgi:hypothetical protein